MGTHNALVLNALDQSNKSLPHLILREAYSVDSYIMRYGATRKLVSILTQKSPLISKVSKFCFLQCCQSAVVPGGVMATSKCVECKQHKLHSSGVVCASVSI